MTFQTLRSFSFPSSTSNNMSRIGIDTRTQEAWKELIHKEAATRMAWNKSYKPKVNENEWFKRRFYTQAVTKPLGRSLPPITAPSSRPTKIPENLSKPIEIPSNDSDEYYDMYPVSEGLKDVLFDGFSKEEKGRYRYLNIRKEIPLENRYQHPISSSMTYGWKLGETGQQFKAPTYARGKIVEESFYRRNGVF